LRLKTVGFCALFAAGLAGATTITYTFQGTATGTAGLTAFTNEPFTITLTGNTDDINTPSCCDVDLSTASGIAGTVYIDTIGTAPLADTQAVFVNPTEETIGIWHYNEPDWLDIVTSAALTYNLQTSIGPITPSAAYGNVQMGGHYLQSYLGNLAFSSVSDVTFSAAVDSTTSDSAPEPATVILLSIGLAALALRARKLSRSSR
jgi:hypothetical protein